MTVWIVDYCDDNVYTNYYCTEKVFSSLEKATDWINKQPKPSYYDYCEWEVE